MTFYLGLMIGGLAGALFGALVMAIMTAGKICDLQDRLDMFELSRGIRRDAGAS